MPMEMGEYSTLKGETWSEEIHGQVNITDGVVCRALKLGGDGAHVRYENVTERCLWQPDLCMDGLTISVWFSAEYSNRPNVIFSSLGPISNALGIQMIIWPASKIVAIQIFASTSLSIVYTGWSGDPEWHHLAGVYHPNGTTSLYLDGNLTDATLSFLPKNPPLGEQDGTFYFGSNWMNQFYEGRIDEFLFWKATKSAEFIKTIFLLNPRTGEYSKRIYIIVTLLQN